MLSDRRVNLVKGNRPPRQIKVSILHATAPPLLDLLFDSRKESRAANRVAAGGHRLPERRVASVRQARTYVR